MRQPAHRFLEEFSTDEQAPPSPIVLPLRRRAEAMQPPPPPERPSDAYAKGYLEGQAVGRSQVEGELAALVADCEQRLEDAKRMFSEAVAHTLTAELDRQLAHMHATIEDQVLAVLSPVLRHLLTDAAIRELTAALRHLARDGEALTIELTGPEDLIQRVWRRYCELEPSQPGGMAPVVRFQPSESPQIRANVNGTLIESRLAEWITRISEVTG
ncbi:MAG: hypothetical protein ACKVP7_05245 [Hyphomicrobiaceae bacterium]